jgi:hypothetical protein
MIQGVDGEIKHTPILWSMFQSMFSAPAQETSGPVVQYIRTTHYSANLDDLAVRYTRVQCVVQMFSRQNGCMYSYVKLNFNVGPKMTTFRPFMAIWSQWKWLFIWASGVSLETALYIIPARKYLWSEI